MKNVVPDHLSRIPNAPIIQAPINEDFPDEHILAIFKEPWHGTQSITWTLGNYPLTGQSKTSVVSLSKYGTSSGKSRIFLSIVPTRLFDDVYQRRNRGVCSAFAMTLHAEDTSVPARLQRRFFKVGFTGPLCSKTHTIFASHARIVRKLEKFQET